MKKESMRQKADMRGGTPGSINGRRGNDTGETNEGRDTDRKYRPATENPGAVSQNLDGLHG